MTRKRALPDTNSPASPILKPAIARAARAYTGLSHIDLGTAAGVSSRTIFKIEKDGKVTPVSLARITEVFERYGITLQYDIRGAVNGLTFK